MSYKHDISHERDDPNSNHRNDSVLLLELCHLHRTITSSNPVQGDAHSEEEAHRTEEGDEVSVHYTWPVPEIPAPQDVSQSAGSRDDHCVDQIRHRQLLNKEHRHTVHVKGRVLAPCEDHNTVSQDTEDNKQSLPNSQNDGDG